MPFVRGISSQESWRQYRIVNLTSHLRLDQSDSDTGDEGGDLAMLNWLMTVVLYNYFSTQKYLIVDVSSFNDESWTLMSSIIMQPFVF